MQAFVCLHFENVPIMYSGVASVSVRHYLLELLRRQLIQGLQLAQALSVTLVEPEEICSAVLQQVQDQTQAGGPGVSH